MNCDYLLEQKLLREAPSLHRIFSANVLSCQNMLQKYKLVFPNYTDHTVLHSMEVIAFCNELIGDQVSALNADEIFILLMAAYLHDSGMGITEEQYREFSEELPLIQSYIAEHPDASTPEVIRTFHNELSGCYIRKYASLFDFPSPEHLFAVVQVSRGHRKTDLYNEAEYPSALMLPNGNPVHLPYLAAVIRLADELDIAADRNLRFLYRLEELTDPEAIAEFKKHLAIRSVRFESDRFVIHMDASDKVIYDKLLHMLDKLSDTLESCVKVTAERTPFRIRQTYIEFISCK